LGELVPPPFVVPPLLSEGKIIFVGWNCPTEIKDVEKRVVIEDVNFAESRRPSQYLLNRQDTARARGVPPVLGLKALYTLAEACCVLRYE